jgi:hypothetical protein
MLKKATTFSSATLNMINWQENAAASAHIPNGEIDFWNVTEHFA